MSLIVQGKAGVRVEEEKYSVDRDLVLKGCKEMKWCTCWWGIRFKTTKELKWDKSWSGVRLEVQFKWCRDWMRRNSWRRVIVEVG